MGEEDARAGLGLLLLVLVVELGRDRMMRVVILGDEIGNGEFEPVGEQPRRLAGRREPEFRPEVEEDVGDMRDDDLAVAQDRRRKGVNGAAFPSRIAISALTPRPVPRSRATST